MKLIKGREALALAKLKATGHDAIVRIWMQSCPGEFMKCRNGNNEGVAGGGLRGGVKVVRADAMTVTAPMMTLQVLRRFFAMLGVGAARALSRRWRGALRANFGRAPCRR